MPDAGDPARVDSDLGLDDDEIVAQVDVGICQQFNVVSCH
jgi:hypothetical protein